jgi:hypothetical protein
MEVSMPKVSGPAAATKSRRATARRDLLAAVVARDAARDAHVKTSLKLRRELWKRAHVRAMDEGVDLQTIVGRALEAYLKDGAR